MTLSSQYAFTHQIRNSYLKENRRYEPDSMHFLQTRSKVKFKVTQLWYATLPHLKVHPHTKFEIPTSNNIRDAPDTIILKTRSEVKVTVTRKWYATLRHPKMHQIWNSYLKEYWRYAPDTKGDGHCDYYKN